MGKQYLKTDSELACDLSIRMRDYHKKNFVHKTIKTFVLEIYNLKIYNKVLIQYNNKTNNVSVNCMGITIGLYAIHPTTNKKLKCKKGVPTQHALNLLNHRREYCTKQNENNRVKKKKELNTYYFHEKKDIRKDTIAFSESISPGILLREIIRYNLKRGYFIYNSGISIKDIRYGVYIDIDA